MQFPMTIIAVAFAAFLTGCAAVGVVATDDPARKLADASQLFDRLDRPLPAERLIQEAIAIYIKRGDDSGLAEAYRIYGFFLKSAAVDHWEPIYRQNGFLDKTTTFATRHERSINYFDLSKATWNKVGRHDQDANLELNIGFDYMLMQMPKKACNAYEASLQANLNYPPAGKVDLPNGFHSFADFIGELKRRASCEA